MTVCAGHRDGTMVRGGYAPRNGRAHRIFASRPPYVSRCFLRAAAPRSRATLAARLTSSERRVSAISIAARSSASLAPNPQAIRDRRSPAASSERDIRANPVPDWRGGRLLAHGYRAPGRPSAQVSRRDYWLWAILAYSTSTAYRRRTRRSDSVLHLVAPWLSRATGLRQAL